MKNTINNLFFELIQVAIGKRICLSHTPSADEWGELYSIAKKQSLVGVSFAGVQRLQSQKQEPPEMLYLTWMGMAAKIQQRNEVVNKQSVELQAKLSADGLRSAILKGQGVGQLYSDHLRGLRQSGDIDVYVHCGMEKAMAYAKEKYGAVEYDYVNAHLPVFDDTEVELHWTLQAMTNLFLNAKLQKWVKENSEKILGGTCSIGNSTIVTPSLQVNRFYILLHAYHHLTGSGVGFRQLMDYYFVLRQDVASDEDKMEINRLFSNFGMKKFASAVMWIMQSVFGLDSKYLLCAPSENEGRFVLDEVVNGGNFGHHDKRAKSIGTGKWAAISKAIHHSISLVGHYPSAAVWHPVWVVWHYMWKRTIGK